MSKTIGKTTRVIGWYHSHPHITVLPSHVGKLTYLKKYIFISIFSLEFRDVYYEDVRTQAMYQLLDQGFIGLIFSCFNEDAYIMKNIRCPGSKPDECYCEEMFQKSLKLYLYVNICTSF
jgi:hypothetical protein